MGSAKLFKVECSNGLSLPAEDANSYNAHLMHTSGARDTVGSLIEMVMEFIGNFREIQGKYEPMMETIITPDRAVEIMNKVKDETSYPKICIEPAIARLNYELKEFKFPCNEFMIYNAMNYGLFQGDVSTLRDHKKSKIDQQVLNYFLPSNE